MKNFMTMIAHRGLHDETKPENSLAAFRAAIEKGFPIETDVRFTKDGKLVVFHDDTLARMAGDGRRVIDCTLEELTAMRLAGSEERIPSLREFLGLLAGQVPLLLEIKNMEGVKAAEIAAAVKTEMEGYAGEYAVQSFQPFYVKAYKKLCPSVPCGLLVSADTPVAEFAPPFSRIKRHLVTHLSLNFLVKPDFVSFNLRAIPKRGRKFKKCKLAWTIRSEAEAASARTVADGVIFENFLPAQAD